MKSDFYTVDQVAEMVDLHPKTIRRLIREGKLNAHKMGGQWRMTSSDLADFTGNEEELNHTVLSVESLNTEPVSNLENQKVLVSSIVDIFVKNSEEALRISSSIMAAMNSRGAADDKARCDYIYYENEKRARFILWGSAKFIGTMMSFFEVITDQY